MTTKTIIFHGINEDQFGLKRPWKVYTVSCINVQGSNYTISVKGMSDDAEASLIGKKLISSTSEDVAVDMVIKQLKASPFHHNLKIK